MYIILNDTKIDILSVTDDMNNLSIFIRPNLEIGEVYNLFKNNNLSTITIYNEDGSINSVYSDYKIIDSFVADHVEDRYIMNLRKYKTEDVLAAINDCTSKIDEVKKDVIQITDNSLTKQSEYALSVVASTFTDEQALNCILLFPEWSGSGVEYKKDERLRYENKFYKVLLDHTSQKDWIPGSTPSLYVEISDPSIEYPEWKQPTGAHDAYSKGDKITYKGKKYISKTDANVWSPDAYPAGWELVE